MNKVTNANSNVTMVDATEAKNRFGEVIKRAYLQEEHLIVRRGGIPVVAIIPVQDYERLVNSAAHTTGNIATEIESSARAAAARTRLRDFLMTAHQVQAENLNSAVDEDSAEQEINSAIAAARKQAKRRRTNGTH